MKDSDVTLDLLYFDGCPSYRQAWNDILDVLVEEKIDASVRLVAVEDMDSARELQFAGSPTIKVNGKDLEDYQGEGVLACRLYKGNDGKGWPSKELLRDRIRGVL
ncbi:MAG: hypothetical protein PF508_03840 [Spirochaeta sp.]|jgi:hypothetical protein|nr:hypothetical protein [Spirochaeta sp.]